MTKQEVKNILMKIRDAESAEKINYILGQIDILDEADFQKALEKIGNSEQGIIDFVKRANTRRANVEDTPKTPINKMFTYGITGNSVHLHLPHNLRRMDPTTLMDNIRLQMLDAIDRIKDIKDSGDEKFSRVDNLCMISPIFYSPTFVKAEGLKFLEDLGFEIKSYMREDLNNEEFLKKSEEARRIKAMFGSDKHVGTASISFDKINSREWQEKKNNLEDDLKAKGISLDLDIPDEQEF